MTERLVFVAVFTPLMLGLFAWRASHDRLVSRGLAIHGEILSVLRLVFGGDSLLAFEVVPSRWWRRGQLVLSVPTDGAPLLEMALSVILDRTPAGYDVMIPGASTTLRQSEEKNLWLPRQPQSLRRTSSTSPPGPCRRTAFSRH